MMPEYLDRMARVEAYIQDHLSEDLGLDALAEAACFSRYHFHRFFRSITGETPADHVRRLRLERAAALLSRRPELSITDIAMRCGFSSATVFGRDFSKRFGISPRAWRESRPSSEAPVLRGFEAPLWLGATGSAPGVGSIRTEILPSMSLAGIKAVGPYGTGVERALEALFRWAGPRGLVSPHPQLVGIPWDDPGITDPSKCRYSICLLVPPDTPTAGGVSRHDWPERTCLTLSYRGHASGLAGAYAELYGRALPASAYVPADDPALELHRGPAIPGPDGPSLELRLCLPVLEDRKIRRTDSNRR